MVITSTGGQEAVPLSKGQHFPALAATVSRIINLQAIQAQLAPVRQLGSE